jgi:hypothetical protein
MSEFETFFVKLKVDSSQLTKGFDDVQKKTDETTKKFKDSEDQTKKTDSEFTKLASSLGKVAGAYFSVGAVLGGFKNAFADVANIGKLSLDTGVNVEKLDAWRKVAKLAGQDASAFTSQIFALAEALQAHPDTILSLLPGLADQLKKLHPTIAHAQAAGRDIGIGSEIISLLYNSGGSQALEEAAAEQERLGVVNPEDVRLQKEFSKATAELFDAFNTLAREINTFLLPNLSDFVTILKNFVQTFTYIAKGWNGLLDVTGEGIGNALYSGHEFFKERDLTGLFDNPTDQKSTIFEKKKDFIDWDTDYGWGKFREEESQNNHQSFYTPPIISPVSNSQASSLAFSGDIHINTSARDAEGIASSLMTELGSQGKTLLAQIQQANAYNDNGVVI